MVDKDALEKDMLRIKVENFKMGLLLERHTEVVSRGDGMMEHTLRQEIHTQIDVILDLSSEIMLKAKKLK
jgi:hypothetical protein